MANRFPLIIDTTDGNKIKEIPAGDNLDLRNVSISDVQNISALGVINAAAITINGEDIQPGAFTDLTDVPNTYQGNGGYSVRVKSDETGLEFFQLGTGESLLVNNLTVAGTIRPQTSGVDVGADSNPFGGVYGNYFQGSIKGNDGSVIFDADNNQIPYSIIVGAPTTISQLENDVDYISAAQLKAVLPEVLGEDLTIEVNNTGNLTGSVFGEDSTLLVDHINSRINAARLTRNGANSGQTLVWNENTEVWEPGTAGDITGLVSNKTDALTVQAGYKITFADTTGRIDGNILAIVPTTRVDLGETQLLDDMYPVDDQGGNIGSPTRKFLSGNFLTLNATTVNGSLNGDVTGNLTGNAAGDHTGTFNGSILASGVLEGELIGSVFADDSSLIIDGINKTISADIAFTTSTGTIEGTTVAILASNRIDQSTTQFLGDIFPENNLGGSVGSLAKRWGAGYFDVFSANQLSIEAISATEVTTSDFNITGQGVGQLSSTTDLELSANNRIKILNAPLRFAPLTTVERDLIVGLNGDVVYNETDGKIQFYSKGAWIDLHEGVFEGNVTTSTGQSDFNDVIVAGNLTVQGTTTSVETTNTTINDNIITLNNGETGAGVSHISGKSGFEVDRGTQSNVQLVWDDNIDAWYFDQTVIAPTVQGIGGIVITTDGSLANELIDIKPSASSADNSINLTANNIRFIGSIASSIDASAGVTGDLTGSVFTDDSTLMVDAVNNKLYAESLDSVAVRASIIDNNGGPLQIKAGDVGDTGNTIFINPYGSDTYINSQAETHTWSTGPYLSTDNPYVKFTTSGAFETLDGAYFKGDLTGSVFADDSTLLVDAVSGAIPYNVLSNAPTALSDFVNDLDYATIVGNAIANNGLPVDTFMTGDLNAQSNNIENANLVNATGDLKGSVVADDSTILVDSVAGKLVGDYLNGQVNITSTDIQTYGLTTTYTSQLADAWTTKLYGGTIAATTNVAVASTAPSTSIGAAGDIEGMIAFDATYMYYCTADYDGAANVWKRVAWSVDTW